MATEAIRIFRGDDTDFSGGCLLRFIISAAAGTDLTGMTASFSLAGLEFAGRDISSGSFTVDLTSKQSATLPYGHLFGTLRAIDTQGRTRTISNKIPFYVTNEPVSEQGGTIHLEIPGMSGASLTIAAGYVSASLPATFWHSGYTDTEMPCPEISGAAAFRIYKNGILQKPGENADYLAGNSIIAFAESLEPEDIITVEKYDAQQACAAGAAASSEIPANSGIGLTFQQFYHMEYIILSSWHYGEFILSQHTLKDILLRNIIDNSVMTADDPFVPSIRDCLFPVNDTWPKFYKHIDSHRQSDTGEYVRHSYIYGLYRIDNPGAKPMLVEQWGETEQKNKSDNEGQITDDERPPYMPAEPPTGTELHEEESVLSVRLEYQPAKCEFISATDGEGQPLDDISTLVEFVPTTWNGGRGYGAPPLLPGIFTAGVGGAHAFNESGDFY